MHEYLRFSRILYFKQAGAPPGLNRWYGPTSSELILRFTILGGPPMLDSQKLVGRTHATRAVAAPMQARQNYIIYFV